MPEVEGSNTRAEHPPTPADAPVSAADASAGKKPSNDAPQPNPPGVPTTAAGIKKEATEDQFGSDDAGGVTQANESTSFVSFTPVEYAPVFQPASIAQIDPFRITYHLDLVTEDGTIYILDQVLTSMQWGQQKSDLAQTLDVEVANVPIRDKVRNVYFAAKLGAVLVASADWGEGKREVFSGRIMMRQMSTLEPVSVQLTARDILYQLQNSEDQVNFPALSTGKDMILYFLKAWDIQPGVVNGPNEKFAGSAGTAGYTHRGPLPKLFSDILARSFDVGNEPIFVMRARTDEGVPVVDVVNQGTNDPIYSLFANTITDVSWSEDISDLVTVVKAASSGALDETTIKKIGDVTKETKLGPFEKAAEGVDPVAGAVVTDSYGTFTSIPGQTYYGKYQAIIDRAQMSDGDLNAEANRILDEKGDLKRTRRVTVPDIPFLRRGDFIEIRAGPFNDFYVVDGVTHNATETKMELYIERRGKLDWGRRQVHKSVAGKFQWDDPDLTDFEKAAEGLPPSTGKTAREIANLTAPPGPAVIPLDKFEQIPKPTDDEAAPTPDDWVSEGDGGDGGETAP